MKQITTVCLLILRETKTRIKEIFYWAIGAIEILTIK